MPSRFWRRPRLNTLDLVGDGDEIDMIEDIECAFDVRFEGQDFDAAYTLGDIEAVLMRRLAERVNEQPVWERLTVIAAEHCAGAVAPDRATTLFARFAKESQDG